MILQTLCIDIKLMILLTINEIINHHGVSHGWMVFVVLGLLRNSNFECVRFVEKYL